MPSATQVAEWIVRHSAEEVGAPVDPMSLEKLLYYAQSFYLALYHRPLFCEEIRAWRWGPVVRAVYEQYARFDSRPIVLPENDWPFIDEDVEDHLHQVSSFFGKYTAPELSNATHMEGPWLEARKGYRRHDSSDVIIPIGSIKQYYRHLLSDGQESLSSQELLDLVPEPRWGTFYVAGICIRHMVEHPFYDMNLAKTLQASVPPSPDLPDEFFAPIRDQTKLDLGDVSSLTEEEIARRIFNAIGTTQGSDTE
jgi:uncharacterized phage-associated protein